MTAGGRVKRVLICEDSRTYAAALSRTLGYNGRFEIVRICRTAEEALAILPRVKPDLVTMDLELPGMTGLEAIEQIMGTAPVPILVLSSHVGARSGHAAAALAAGALDAIAKDSVDLHHPASASAVALRERVKILSGARVIRHPRARLRAPRPSANGVGRTASAIGICASTGGPQALGTLLGGLPAAFRIPILVVQHISPGFTEGLAAWLDGAVELRVQLARDGAKATAGVWIAPEGAHLLLKPGSRLTLDDTTESGPHRPSADILLESLAAAEGPNAVAVVLTGMGRDGARGIQAVRRAGGLTIAQDRDSSAVFGMPKAAAESGAEQILPLVDIAGRLAELRPAERLNR